jgi:hypothetical protein
MSLNSIHHVANEEELEELLPATEIGDIIVIRNGPKKYRVVNAGNGVKDVERVMNDVNNTVKAVNAVIVDNINNIKNVMISPKKPEKKHERGSIHTLSAEKKMRQMSIGLPPKHLKPLHHTIKKPNRGGRIRKTSKKSYKTYRKTYRKERK